MIFLQCSIALAIRQKELAFALLSLILLSQLFQSLLWHFISARKVPSSPKVLIIHTSINGSFPMQPKSSRPSLMAYLMLSCRDLFLVEAVGWSLVALLTGISLVQQFVLLRPCTKVIWDSESETISSSHSALGLPLSCASTLCHS